MKLRKLMAGSLAVTMVVGSSMTVLAEDGTSSATGTGTSFDHVNKEVTTVTLPTASEVANVFDYYVDPERVLDSAGKLTNGSAVTANADGVYFANKGTSAGTDTNASVKRIYLEGGTYTSLDTDNDGTDDFTITIPTNTTATKVTYTSGQWLDESSNEVTGISISDNTITLTEGDYIEINPFVSGSSTGTTTYSSSSEAVNFEGKNSVDVDVSVAATVTAASEKDIALVADEDALAAATSPALLMKLNVGSDSQAITSDGATAKATIEGKEDNFAVTLENGAYVYKIRTDIDPDNGGTELDAWDSTTVQLVGKTNQKDIPEGTNAMTAPTINLTWTVAKHADAPDSYLSTTTLSSTSNTVTATLPQGVTVSKITLLKAGATSSVTMVSGNHYTLANNTYTFTSTMVNNWKGGTLTFAFSDDTTETITIQ